MSSHPIRARGFLFVAIALVLAACGSSADDPHPSESSTSSTAAATTRPTTPQTSAPPTTVSETTVAPTSTVASREPLDDQTPPAGLNGVEVVGDSLWIASISANQVIEADRATGAILTRIDAGAAGPDDVALGPDGAVYYTGFADGSIGRIADGEASIVGTIEPGVNPLGFADNGDLIVGLAITADALYRLPGGTAPAELIAEDLGDLNAFHIDGARLLGPTGGIGGPGSITSVALDTATVDVVATDLPAVTASTLGADGLLYVLAGGVGEILTFDPATSEVVRGVHQLSEGFFDNLSFSDDGTLYVSHFAEPVVTVIGPDGTMSALAIGIAS